MANSVDMHLNIHNSLNRDLDKTLRRMESFNDKLSRSEKMFGGMEGRVSKTNDKLFRSNKALNNIASTARRIVPAMGVIFGGGLIVQGVRDVVQYSQSFRELAFRMADGTDATKNFTETMASSSLATGIATEEIGDMIINLKELRVPLDNLGEAVKTVARFSEVTGVSSDQTARLYGEMMRTGKMSSSMTSETLASFAAIQKTLGLSRSEMDNVSGSIARIIQRMNQLGKSSKEASNMAKSTLALAAAFSKVGIEADLASDIIDDLLNPERIEDNAFLYAKLGISISDAFAGNIDVVGQMIPRMTQLGKELQNMSGPAAAAMARSLGLPLNTLRQFGEIDLGFEEQAKLAKLMGEEGLNASEALAEMYNKTSGVDRVFRDIGNTIRNIAAKGAEILGRHISGFVGNLREFDKSAAFNKINQTMENIASSMVSFIQKSGGLEGIFESVTKHIGNLFKFITTLPKYLPLIGVGLVLLLSKFRKKLYSSTIGAVKDMTGELKTVLEGVYTMSKDRSEEIMAKKISPRKEAGRPEFFSAEAGAAREKARIENTLALAAASKEILESTKDNKSIVESEIAFYEARRNQLEEIAKTSKATTFDLLEEEEIAKRLNTLTAQKVALTNKEEILIDKERRERARLLTFASKQELVGMYRKYEVEAKLSEESFARSIAESKEINKRANLTRQVITSLEEKLKNEQDPKISFEINEELKKFVGLNQLANSELYEQKEIRMRIREEMKTQSELMKELTDKKGEDFFSEQSQRIVELTSGYGKFLNTTGQVFRMAGERAIEIKDNFILAAKTLGQSVANAAKNTWEAMKHPGELLKKGAGAVAKGAGNITVKGMEFLKDGLNKVNKGLMNVVGPMALIGLGMKLLQPVIEELKPVFDSFMDLIQNALISVIQSIAPPFLRILSALMPIAATLVNVALPPLVTVLGYTVKILGFLIKAINGFIKGINTLPFVKGKLDDVVSSLGDIGENLYDAADSTIQAGKDMWTNKVISNEAVKGIQNSIYNTADKLSSGEITLTTKEQNNERFTGVQLDIDKDGGLIVNYPKTESVSAQENSTFSKRLLAKFDDMEKLMGSVKTEMESLNDGIEAVKENTGYTAINTENTASNIIGTKPRRGGGSTKNTLEVSLIK